MKSHAVNYVFLLVVAAFLFSCGKDAGNAKVDCCEELDANSASVAIKDLTVDDEELLEEGDMIQLQEIKSSSDFKSIKPVGKLSQDLSHDGFNVCLKREQGEMVFKVLKVSGNVSRAVNSTTLDSETGVEVWYDASTTELYVALVSEKFKSYRNNVTVHLAAPGNKFDCKITNSTNVISNNPPAIIGVNDARDASVQKSNGIVGNLGKDEHVRVHADKLSSGNHDVVFSSDDGVVEYNSSYSFKDFGVPFWGCKMTDVKNQ